MIGPSGNGRCAFKDSITLKGSALEEKLEGVRGCCGLSSLTCGPSFDFKGVDALRVEAGIFLDLEANGLEKISPSIPSRLELNVEGRELEGFFERLGVFALPGRREDLGVEGIPNSSSLFEGT